MVLYKQILKPYKIEVMGWLWGVYSDWDSLLLIFIGRYIYIYMYIYITTYEDGKDCVF
jgi:hypothetical protein